MTEEFSGKDRERFEEGAIEAEAGYSVDFLRSLPRVDRPQEPSEEAGAVVRFHQTVARWRHSTARQPKHTPHGRRSSAEP